MKCQHCLVCCKVNRTVCPPVCRLESEEAASCTLIGGREFTLTSILSLKGEEIKMRAAQLAPRLIGRPGVAVEWPGIGGIDDTEVSWLR